MIMYMNNEFFSSHYFFVYIAINVPFWFISKQLLNNHLWNDCARFSTWICRFQNHECSLLWFKDMYFMQQVVNLYSCNILVAEFEFQIMLNNQY